MRLSWLHYPVIGLFLALLLVWFSFSLRPVQSSLQYDFDAWLDTQRTAIEDFSRYLVDSAEIRDDQANETLPDGAPLTLVKVKEASPGTPKEQLPVLRASVQVAGARAPVEYLVEPNVDPDRASQILRLLDLMKEAGIFDRDIGATGPITAAQSVVHIVVSGPTRSFETTLTQPEIERSVPALLLMRLFEEYSGGGREVLPGADRRDVAALSDGTPSRGQGSMRTARDSARPAASSGDDASFNARE